MDWKTVNFDWNRARAFLITAEEGSLTAAARALGTTQPTLGRQVTALEDELGTVLFDRAGGKLQLTPGGESLLEHVRTMGEAAAHVSRLADGQSTEVKGKVSISASEVYCAHLLPPAIEKIRRQEPGIQLEIIASNETSDLSRREADIAVRNFRPEEEELVARKLRDDKAWLYATSEYLASIGNPSALADYSRAEFISFADTDSIINWLNGAGMSLTAQNFPLMTESYLVHWQLVKRGLGLGIMPEAIGDKEPLVIRACPSLDAFVFPIWLVSHRELKTSRRIRIVFDLLAAELGKV